MQNSWSDECFVNSNPACTAEDFFYVHVTVHHNKFLFNKQPASKQSQDGTSWLCLEAVIKPAWNLPVPNVQ